MFRSLNFICVILLIKECIYANPVTNFDSGTKSDTFVFELPKSQDAQSLLSRVSSLSASGQSYGDTSHQNEARSSSSSANGRILRQPTVYDKDSITYPDEIVRDSYGNIVTPYTTLVEDSAPLHTSTSKPPTIGLFTDVNKDNGQHLQFVIPGYSDGITELQGPYKPSPINNALAPPILTLLPPLSSGNYNYPSLATASKPTADNSYQNEISGSFSLSAPSNPVPTGPTAVTTNGHIGSVDQSNAFNQQSNQPELSQPVSGTDYTSKSSFASGSQNQQVKGAPLHGSSDFSAIQVSSAESPGSTIPFSNTKPQKDTQFVNQIPIQIQVETGKYTGGFGGADGGIFREQKTPGYAVKETTANKPLSVATNIPQVNPGTNSIQIPSTVLNLPSHVTPQQSISSNQGNQGNFTPPKPINTNPRATFGPSNTSHGSFQFGTAVSVNPIPNSQINNSGKYTGGFGGPEGILAPFDNIKAESNVATNNSATSSIGAKRKY